MNRNLFQNGTCLPSEAVCSILEQTATSCNSPPCGMSQPSLRCRSASWWCHWPWPLSPILLGSMLLTLPNLVKFQPADFKALTHIFNTSFPSFRPYSMFGMLSHSSASLTFSVRHLAECDSSCSVVQTSLVDDDRPPYHRGSCQCPRGQDSKTHQGHGSRYVNAL